MLSLAPAATAVAAPTQLEIHRLGGSVFLLCWTLDAAPFGKPTITLAGGGRRLAAASVLLGLRDRLGASLLVIEHDISLIASISDRLIALDQGAIVASGAPATVLDHPEVVASYLGAGGATLHRSAPLPGGSR